MQIYHSVLVLVLRMVFVVVSERLGPLGALRGSRRWPGLAHTLPTEVMQSVVVNVLLLLVEERCQLGKVVVVVWWLMIGVVGDCGDLGFDSETNSESHLTRRSQIR